MADALSRLAPPAVPKVPEPRLAPSAAPRVPELVKDEEAPKEPPEEPLEARGFVCNAIAPGIDYQELAVAQTQDPDVQAYRTAITNLKVRDVPFSDGAFTMLCDVSSRSARPIIPETWRVLL